MMKKRLIYTLVFTTILLSSSLMVSSDIPIYTKIIKEDDVLSSSIKNIDPTKPIIALTFDDGSTKVYTT